MQNNHRFTNRSAARIVAGLFGSLAGFGGIVHGIGEVLQGSIAPDGLVFNSWVHEPIATGIGGEPAMSIVPNLLLTGLLAIVVSSVVLIWSVANVHRKNGGRILMLLSLAMLLVGGGFGSPLIGFLAGWAGTMINTPLKGWRGRLSPRTQQLSAQLWPWFFGLAAFSATFLTIGSLILVFFFGLNDSDLFLNAFYLTVLTLLGTVILTPFFDARQSGRQVTT